MTALGMLREDDERCAVRFERLYDATPDELWAALTDPAQLAGWLADATRFELRVGGVIELRFGDSEGGLTTGRVVAVDPPRVLEYTWTYPDEPESVVRFELVPRGEGCLLVLDHSRLARTAGAGYAAGWQAHLEALEARLAGRPAGDEDAWWRRYRELRPGYARQAAALGWGGWGGNELHEAVAEGDAERARALASERPQLMDQPDAEGLLPAMRALYTSGGELAAALSPADDRLDVFHAAAFGRLDRLRALLGADDELRAALSGDGFTALHLACFAGGEDATRVLVNHGAPLETVSRHAQVQVRPLGTAAFSRDHASARVLLDAGADPNGAGSEGFRPLHTAAQNGDLELVRLLLAHGADPSAATDDGRTPQQIAREAGHADAAGLLAGDRAVAQG